MRYGNLLYTNRKFFTSIFKFFRLQYMPTGKHFNLKVIDDV